MTSSAAVHPLASADVSESRQATLAPVVRSGAVLALVLTGQFMAILDVSIVNVAAPRLRADLHASGAGLQMVVAGYTISYAVLLITGARLGDRFGHGRAFQIGLAGFTATSLLCGLAPTTSTLIAFRLAQGVCAALMMPQVMSLIQRTFSGAARARALSLYSAVIACGAVVGQSLGGVLVSADLFGTGWRPVFLVNVPIGIALLILAAKRLPRGDADLCRQLDPLGVLTLSCSTLLLVVPLVLGHEEHWPTWGWLSMSGSIGMFAVFVMIETRLAAHGGAPLVSARVLRSPGLIVGATALFLAMINYSGYLFAMALHLQSGLGETPARAGMTFAPLAVGFAITGLTWRFLPHKLHGPMMPIGLVIAAVAYLLLIPVLRSGERGGVGMEIILFVLGLALGLAFSPMLTAALTHVQLSDAADASGVLITVFQFGQVVGVATLGTTYLSLVHANGPRASGHAVAVTLALLATLALLTALLAALLIRRPRMEKPAAAA